MDINFCHANNICVYIYSSHTSSPDREVPKKGSTRKRKLISDASEAIKTEDPPTPRAPSPIQAGIQGLYSLY